MIKWFRVEQDDEYLKTQCFLHVSLYHFVNLFQNNLAIKHSTNKWSAFDQCHGNKDNLVAVSFSSCAEFCLYTEYYELFYIETRIILPHLYHEKEVSIFFVFLKS